jgi:hypothetical protein
VCIYELRIKIKDGFGVSKPGRAVERSAGWEMVLDTFRGVSRCILVRGTGYGDVLVGSWVMVLKWC